MNKKSYIPAFTIVEALVSMAITAIILSIIFVIFSITSERLLDFKKQNEGITDLNRLSYSINKTIFESKEMSLNYNSDELIFSDYYGNTTEYVIAEDYFLRRKGEFIDTFKLATKQLHIDILQSPSKNDQYQRLSWNLMIDKKVINLNFYKKIYADELLKEIDKNEF